MKPVSSLDECFVGGATVGFAAVFCDLILHANNKSYDWQKNNYFSLGTLLSESYTLQNGGN